MPEQLIVKEQLLIGAPVSKVWEVLIAPKYIRQWDELPGDFGDFYLELGRIIDWSGISRMTVTVCEPNESLVFSLYASKWEQPPAAYDIVYRYDLSEEDGFTKLALSIGDFSVLPDGQAYFDSAVLFAESALGKIKNLAENRL